MRVQDAVHEHFANQGNYRKLGQTRSSSQGGGHARIRCSIGSSSSFSMEIDISFFDVPSMGPESAMPAAGPAPAGEPGFGNSGSDEDKEQFSNLMHDEEEVFSHPEVESDDDLQRKALCRPHIFDEVNDGQSSQAAGSAKTAISAAGMKTPATDLDILKGCLGPERRARWDVMRQSLAV